MNLKEKLSKIKNEVLKSTVNVQNRDYEFDAEFENHTLGNQNIYRLYYINYHRINEYPGNTINNVGVIDWPFKPFMLPDGMCREDAFKILSYLTDYIEASKDLEPASYNSVAMLDNVINLERLGFKRVDLQLDSNSDEVINLYTVTGRLLLFKGSNHYEKYFEWYTEGITFDEVKEIYDRCGIDFYDLVPIAKNENKIFLKIHQLVKKK